ncbi:hypothetical protein PIB30_066212 [Stylosanthes scabra]|uniref:F-box domain-containing protein n=1 Tax=Stylosanthes scabra TaxID=79078 RepID=A0ABU6YPU3_9FABA|nr:hypothetical protein [Stylosanthes scabra]
MSGLLPGGSQMPFLPDEVMIDIFNRLDAAAILACRSTCRHWRQMLTSYEFIVEVAKQWLARGSYLFVHFGFSLTEELSVDWMMKMDSITGEMVAQVRLQWNPATGQRLQLDDPLQHHCTECPYHYALVYYPASVEYAVLHISKEHEDNALPILKMYTSFQRNWDFEVPCLAFVRR